MASTQPERQAPGEASSLEIPTAVVVWTCGLVLLWFGTTIAAVSNLSAEFITLTTTTLAAITISLHAYGSSVKNTPRSPSANKLPTVSSMMANYARTGLGLLALLNAAGAAANCSTSLSAFLPSFLVSAAAAWCLCRLDSLESESLSERAVDSNSESPHPIQADCHRQGVAEKLDRDDAEKPLDERIPVTSNVVPFDPNKVELERDTMVLEPDTACLRESQTQETDCGQRTSAGCVNAELSPHEKSTELVIAFDPPFANLPDFDFELTEESLQARVLNRTNLGVRVAVRSLQGAGPEPIPFSLEWFAQEPDQEAAAAATQPISTNLP